MAIVNFCSVVNKRAELKAFLLENTIDVLIGTESHLDGSLNNSELFPQNYNVFRKDRDRFGGGVLILVKHTVPSIQIELDSTIEIIWVELHLEGKGNIIIGSFYGPPPLSANLINDLTASVTQVKQKFPSAKIILGGDFNCPGIDWELECLTDSYIPSHIREELIEFAHDARLDQIVTFPTRANNILDLCFTTHPNNILSCEPIPGVSDHDAVIAAVQTALYVPKNHLRKIHLYKSANWDKIKEKLNDISDKYFDLNLHSTRTLDENWSFFLQNFLQIINDFVPTKLLGNRTHLPWMTTALKRQIQKRNRVYKRARRFNRDSDWLEYKELKKQVAQACKHGHKIYLNNIITSSNSTKPLWRYIKARRQEKIGISTLKSPNGDTVTDPTKMADILNNHFHSVFTVEQDNSTPCKGPSLYPTMQHFEITTEGVFNILHTLNPQKSPGPDGLHPFALKATANEISPVLTHLFQQSIDSGDIPSDWKHAYVTPVYKKGGRNDPQKLSTYITYIGYL